MNVNGVSTVNTKNQTVTKSAEQQNSLGKDAFMRILVTQLKNQDPLEPLKDTEFIGQMAQFSSLEQLTNLNTAVNSLVGLQGNQSLTEHADLLGNTVYWEYQMNGQEHSGEGIVKALSLKNGELMVELEDEQISIPIQFIHRIEKQVDPQN